jgi:hypothetical protein
MIAGVTKSRSPKRKKGSAGRRPAPGRPDGVDLGELQDRLRAAGAPDEVLQALSASGDPEEVLRRLLASDLVPSQEDILSGLLETFAPLLEPSCDPLAAELTGYEFLGSLRANALDRDDVPEMLSDLMKQAEVDGRPEALAMLRLLAAIGPDEIRPAAAEAGTRLVAGGLTDPPWAIGLGAPTVGRCFGYADSFGAQQSVAITFGYGRNRHALVVLIDHDLGGGVKDCFATDQPDVIHRQFRQATRRPGLTYADYEPAEVRQILEQALAEQPCPAQPDQVADLRDFLDLLRRRVALLTG